MRPNIVWCSYHIHIFTRTRAQSVLHGGSVVCIGYDIVAVGKAYQHSFKNVNQTMTAPFIANKSHSNFAVLYFFPFFKCPKAGNTVTKHQHQLLVSVTFSQILIRFSFHVGWILNSYQCDLLSISSLVNCRKITSQSILCCEYHDNSESSWQLWFCFDICLFLFSIVFVAKKLLIILSEFFVDNHSAVLIIVLS